MEDASPENLSQQGERMKLARTKAGYASSAKSACTAFGFPYETYKKQESGQRRLKWPEAVRYARAFRVNPVWLISGRGEADVLLSADEAALLEAYQELPEPGRRAVTAFVDLVKMQSAATAAPAQENARPPRKAAK